MRPERHDMLVTLANTALDQLEDSEIIELCPSDYGGEVTEDHLNYLWDKFYTDYNNMDDEELYRFWDRIQEASARELLTKWMEGESDEEPIVVPNPSRTLH